MFEVINYTCSCTRDHMQKHIYNLYMRSDLTYVNYFECVLCMSLASVQDCVTYNKNNKS